MPDYKIIELVGKAMTGIREHDAIRVQLSWLSEKEIIIHFSFSFLCLSANLRMKMHPTSDISFLNFEISKCVFDSARFINSSAFPVILVANWVIVLSASRLSKSTWENLVKARIYEL